MTMCYKYCKSHVLFTLTINVNNRLKFKKYAPPSRKSTSTRRGGGEKTISAFLPERHRYRL
jgi:hypothetical protein